MAVRDPPDSDPSSSQTAQLLAQLMQIARISALKEMASGIAHELNQPIGAIATFAQTGARMLSRSEPMIDEARDVLHHISDEALKAGQRLRHIRGLLDGVGAARTDCDLSDVIAELRPVLALLAERAGARLEIQIQPDLPSVSIDRLGIQHVIFELMQNAFEAPIRTGAKPVVRLELSGDRYSVQTTVNDAGAGIAAEVRERLFRPFFTTKPTGSGLGLASSQAIVDSHDGTIGFEAIDGGGAHFWFRLPANSGANEP